METISISGLSMRTIHSINGLKPLQFRASSSLHARSPFRFTKLRFRSTSCSSFADDTTINSTTTEVAVKGLSLEVKKKASDLISVLRGTSIFLVGMDNSVKTSLGKLLADALRYYYFDSDNLVLEAAGGEDAVKAMKESDEKGYREAETEVLKQLSSMGRLVVCAGNGAVQSSTNLALLRHGISIWIDVPLDMITRGLVEDRSELPTSELSALYDGFAIADATISLQKVASQLGYDDLEAVTEDMALEVLTELDRLTRVKKLMEEAARPF